MVTMLNLIGSWRLELLRVPHWMGRLPVDRHTDQGHRATNG